MTDSEELKKYMTENELTNDMMAGLLQVCVRTVVEWRSGRNNIPAPIMRIIKGEGNNNVYYMKTIYKLIKYIEDIELELIAIKRRIGMDEIHRPTIQNNSTRFYRTLRQKRQA